jgi:hypothetical protein
MKEHPMSTFTSPGPVDKVEAVLMAIPYGEWISMPEAARRHRDLGLARELLTAVVRKGRRRGVLRTETRAEATYVMRVRRDLGA